MSQLVSTKSSETKTKPAEPKIFIGIPTGPTKLYSTYYIVAALANLDYGNMEIHWAVTGGCEDPSFLEFRDRLQKMMEAVAWSPTVSWKIHYVPLTRKERLTRYEPILRNKTVLRDKFLDGDCDYFLLLGGDNPPPRNSIRRLLKIDADVAMGTCYQRPGVDPNSGVYPLVWQYAWMPNELDKLQQKLHPLVLEELRLAWLNCPPLLNISFHVGWRRTKTHWGITGGDGCALIKREVLEMIDWGTVPTITQHSEDIHFMGLALWYGFSTAVATDLHVPHHDPNGRVY